LGGGSLKGAVNTLPSPHPVIRREARKTSRVSEKEMKSGFPYKGKKKKEKKKEEIIR
jgi:hypothetical protein